ncbi:MAG: heme biosynthesis HemY N-terminal domain-containing protein [Betaproteobacteria bacterium]
MMRALFAFLLLAVLAVLMVLLFKLNAGYAMFVSPPYRVELSLNALFLFLLAAFVVLYLLVRFSARIAGMPREVRDARRRSNIERARGKQDAAVVALLEGRYGKARQFAEEALAIPHSSGLAALVGARAAIDTRDFDAAEQSLRRADAETGSLAVPRLMLLAETALERGQLGEALAQLGNLKREAGLHTAALRLELRALTAAGRHAEVPPLVDQLVKRRVYDVAQGDLVRAGAHAEALAALRQDATGLRNYWNRLSDTDKQNPKVARAGATGFLMLGGDREAAEIIVRSLERTWDSELTTLYAQCRTPEPTRQLQTAEHWLLQHSQDAKLLYSLGRMCEKESLWGKAQTYLEASLALDNHWRTHVALGEMHGRLGRDELANSHLASALKLAMAELKNPERDSDF